MLAPEAPEIVRAARLVRSSGIPEQSSRSPLLNTAASTVRCLPRSQIRARGLEARFFTHWELLRTVLTASSVP